MASMATIAIHLGNNAAAALAAAIAIAASD